MAIVCFDKNTLDDSLYCALHIEHFTHLLVARAFSICEISKKRAERVVTLYKRVCLASFVATHKSFLSFFYFILFLICHACFQTS